MIHFLDHNNYFTPSPVPDCVPSHVFTSIAIDYGARNNAKRAQRFLFILLLDIRFGSIESFMDTRLIRHIVRMSNHDLLQ